MSMILKIVDYGCVLDGREFATEEETAEYIKEREKYERNERIEVS